jgi:polyisoprenyl-phosphate glycosyltransferase
MSHNPYICQMSNKKDLSIIIPIYNEEKNIPVLFERLEKVVSSLGLSYEFLFVNDGSKDNSLLLLKELATNHKDVKYIDFSRNFGHQVAVSAGLDNTIGNAVVIIDADLQDPPELIESMYNKLRREEYEVVYAKRRKRDGEGFLKLATAKLFYRILSKITSISIPVDTGDFRIIDHKVVEILRKMPEKDKFLRGQISWIGFRQTFVEYDRAERFSGETGYTYSKMIKFALDGITGFSDFPLKIVSIFGFLVSGIAFVVSLFALYSRFISKNYVAGWTSLMLSILFLGGIQLISIGIIGEYLARMNNNIKNRPLYIIKQTNIEEPSH